MVNFAHHTIMNKCVCLDFSLMVCEASRKVPKCHHCAHHQQRRLVKRGNVCVVQKVYILYRFRSWPADETVWSRARPNFQTSQTCVLDSHVDLDEGRDETVSHQPGRVEEFLVGARGLVCGPMY